MGLSDKLKTIQVLSEALVALRKSGISPEINTIEEKILELVESISI